MTEEFVEDMAKMTSDHRIVVLLYQSFCDPCGSMKPQIEMLAEKHSFELLRINVDGKISPELAGLLVPSITAYTDGMAAAPLRGARTTEAIVDYLIDAGIVDEDAA